MKRSKIRSFDNRSKSQQHNLQQGQQGTDLIGLRMSRNVVPGPGSYKQVDSFNKTGSYIQSILQNNRCQRFDKEPRYNQKDIDRVPGPGMYRQSFQLDPRGSYYLSRFRGSKATRFAQSSRRCVFDGTGWNSLLQRKW